MAQELGKSFITYFYQSYDGDRTALQNIYVRGSLAHLMDSRTAPC